jgi:tetratricopeptide (TPR) repeat protein
MHHDEGVPPPPLAEMMMHAESSGVIESMNRIHELARGGTLRSALTEAFDAVQQAPMYLPLHNLIGELLIQDNRLPEAIAKFSVVAHAYGVRGEASQATKLWRRIIRLAPMDLAARTSLIDLLVARGQVDDAIREYMELAETYYRLADLSMARNTYTTALRVVQQANADRAWNVKLLQRMADIDMQRVDWKQAMRVLEQIRTLQPDDQGVRRQLMDLFTRMGQGQQATAELDSYLTYVNTNGKGAEAIPFLEELAKEHEGELLYRRVLAAQLHRLGRTAEAVSQLDALGESLLDGGRTAEAVEVITQIVSMNPPNAAAYQKLLSQMTK